MCTTEGVTNGTALTQYPIENITKPAGTCAADSACNVAGGQYCNKDTPTSACACTPSTGVDSCTSLGRCMLSPCARCQRCISSMQTATRNLLDEKGTNKPSQTQIVGALMTMCEPYANVAGYSSFSTCQFIIQSYLMPAGSSGYFGLRPGAVCKSLGECSALPPECKLKVTEGTPLANVTGGLDMCTAEGVSGGSALTGVVTVAGEDQSVLATCMRSVLQDLHGRRLERSTAAPAWQLLVIQSNQHECVCCRKKLGVCGSVTIVLLACLLAQIHPACA